MMESALAAMVSVRSSTGSVAAGSGGAAFGAGGIATSPISRPHSSVASLRA